MENIAVIKDGIVENLVAVDETTRESTRTFWESQGYTCVDDAHAGPGYTYEDGEFIPPPPPPPPPPPIYEWYIDLGPFFDRFGESKLAVLTSDDAGVKALLADINVRKWVDLKNTAVAQGVAYIGSKIPAVTEELQDAILNTPVSEEENLALRKLYFS